MLKYTAMPTEHAQSYRSGGEDALGNTPERSVSDGGGNPCRHCLTDIPKGAGMLILSYKPFKGSHPYTEIGPIFLCTDTCETGTHTDSPEILTTSPDYLLKGYCTRDRIVYGTGQITPAQDIPHIAAKILSDPAVAYVHVRSARNNCYQLRIDRDA